MKNIVDGTTLLSPTSTVRNTEIQPLIRLHLRTCRSGTDGQELGQERGKVDWYSSNGDSA